MNYIQVQPFVTSAFKLQKPDCGFTHRNAPGVINKRMEGSRPPAVQGTVLSSCLKEVTANPKPNTCAWEPLNPGMEFAQEQS